LYFILLILTFLLIFYQDITSRMVYWFLYFFVAGLSFIIHNQYQYWKIVLIFSLINAIFITVLILTSFMYAKYIMQQNYLNYSIGMGDIFMFFALTFLFPPITFLILLIASLVFSLFLHFLFKKKYKIHKNVPLAGYMAFFYSLILIISLYSKNIFFIH
jgi:hypothetical protein